MKKLIILLLLLALALGLFIYFSRPALTGFTNSEKQKKLTDLLGRRVNLTDQKPGADQKYSGKYASFSYPGSAKEYTYRDPEFVSDPGLLESFSYDMKTPKTVFNYAASKREDVKTLDDNPSFRLRTLPERGYKKSNADIPSSEAVVFQKDDQTPERSLFILRKGIVYTFVLTGSDPGVLDTRLKDLISSLKFSN